MRGLINCLYLNDYLYMKSNHNHGNNKIDKIDPQNPSVTIRSKRRNDFKYYHNTT